jgi:hypothetical protein
MKYLKLFEDFIPTESNSDTLYFFDKIMVSLYKNILNRNYAYSNLKPL